MSRHSLPALLATLFLIGTLPAAAADDGKPVDGPDALLEKWMDVYHERATSLEMLVEGNPQRPLELQTTPLLKYTNPVRNVQQHGSLYLWTQSGRPALIAAVWSALDRTQPGMRRLNLEWHSLLKNDVVARRNGEELWNAGQPGVEWQPVPDAGSPAAARALRLSQMRRIARSLTARIDTGESELRLMAQPVYRYPEHTADVIDGAVFAYVMGTDPEVMLLVEAQQLDDESPAWRIACARFTNFPIEVRYRDQLLWSQGRTSAERRTGAYALFLGVEQLPADLTGSAATAANSGTSR